MLGPSAAPMAVLCLLLCLVHLFQGAAAVVCNCFNGHVVHIDSCACACNAGYLEPTCTFGVNDIVPISFSLNMTAAAFSSELFTNAVSFAASATATFVTAKNVSKFNAVRATVSMPGYTVSRVLDSVELRDPWVAEYKVISAHVVTPGAATDSSEFDVDYTFYEAGNIVVTLMGVVYLAAALVLAVGLVAIDSSMTHNSDEYMMGGIGGHDRPRREKRQKPARTADTDTPTPQPSSPHRGRQTQYRQ